MTNILYTILFRYDDAIIFFKKILIHVCMRGVHNTKLHMVYIDNTKGEYKMKVL